MKYKFIALFSVVVTLVYGEGNFSESYTPNYIYGQVRTVDNSQILNRILKKFIITYQSFFNSLK
mgnify:FL=1